MQERAIGRQGTDHDGWVIARPPCDESTVRGCRHLLGHSSIVLTSNTYGHVLEQRQRQVAMGMDEVLGG